MYKLLFASGKVTLGGYRKEKKMHEGGMVIEDMTTMIRREKKLMAENGLRKWVKEKWVDIPSAREHVCINLW